MIDYIARQIVQGFNNPSVVFDFQGNIIKANNEYVSLFFDKKTGKEALPDTEFQIVLEETIASLNDYEQSAHRIINWGNNTYKINVYYLNRHDGHNILRLVVLKPALKSNEGFRDIDSHGFQEKLSPQFSKLIGQDPNFLQILLLAQRSALTDLPVLIIGESGTGKEVLARTIHQASHRRNNAFEDVNCAAIPDSLVESELFGYEAGSFTGASNKGKTGIFENANHGTIFMDEIGDAASQTQAKLLRILESGRFKRIGGNRNLSTDIRLISATNQNLNERIAEGRFREDLLYRINTITIRLPSLRERKNDIPLLANHFLKINKTDKTIPLRFSEDVMQVLITYKWPGNVRELKGVVEYAVTMTTGSVINIKALPSFLKARSIDSGMTIKIDTFPIFPESRTVNKETNFNDTISSKSSHILPSEQEPTIDLLTPMIENLEKQQIKKVLGDSHTRSEAIRRLGISRRTFYSKLKQYGLE